MTIDRTTGELTLGENSMWRPSLHLKDFLNSSWADDCKTGVKNAGFESYHLRTIDEGQEIALTLTFFQGILSQLSFACIEGSTSWADWSVQNALKLKEKHDQILLRCLGAPPYKFPWGEIWSSYDPRSGSSAVGVRYLSFPH